MLYRCYFFCFSFIFQLENEAYVKRGGANSRTISDWSMKQLALFDCVRRNFSLPPPSSTLSMG